ncbi:MAG: hypothetical protein KH828_14285 [Clostridiales bacterium]|nr:hypothetical protein [Clostridiales bacterium]
MKKKMLSIMFAVVLALSVIGCSSSPKAENKPNEPAKTEEKTDDKKEKDNKKEEAEKSETLEESKELEELEGSQELNKYGITDQQLESFVSTMKERVQKEYFEVHEINPEGFTWAEGHWLDDIKMESLVALAMSGMPISQEQFKDDIVSFEADSNDVNQKSELRALVMEICINWLADEEIDYETFVNTTQALYYDVEYAERLKGLEELSGYTEAPETTEDYVKNAEVWSRFIRENVAFS